MKRHTRPSKEQSSMVDILQRRAQNQPDCQAYIFLQNGETESGSLTYKELDRKARAIASHLQSWQKERALLLYHYGLEFITAFFGCLYAGVVAVPVYPPKGNQKLSRLLAIENDAQAKIALTTTPILADLGRRWEQEIDLLVDLKWIATDAIENDEQDFSPQFPRTDSLAFLQYTSGSTGTPKGVMVTHGNIIHNQHLIQTAFGHSEKSIGVGWLPLFHDMGLIGHVLQPIYVGFPSILMPPVAVLMKPIRWLKAISKYKATTSGGPNFAYDLCAKKVKPEQLANIDLSSWDVAFNGAEPIRAETLEQFSKKFAQCGFNYSAFYPCYGMAETTLLTTGGDKNHLPVIQGVKSRELEQNSVVESEISSAESRLVVGCGTSPLNTTVIIINPESLTRCGLGQVGEIWVSGGSVASGYWNRPEATQETFQAYLKDTGEGPFLRTGDLGFLSNGELFVTGRMKDVIIIRGSNHYPQDIELTVENSHPSLREHCSAAFSLEIEGEEGLVVACEVERTYLRKLNTDEVVREIQIAVSTEHELEVHGVVLLKTGSIPKTSSGKIQRRACKRGFLEGSLNIVGQWKKTNAENPKIIRSNSQLNTQDYSSTVRSHPKTVAEIEGWLVNKIAQLLQISPEKIDLKQPLAIYGLNSVKAVNIASELEEWLGTSVVPTIVYEYPSIQALADYLGQTTPALESSTFVSNSQIGTEAIAIVGLGCRFPKANNPQAFWSLLRSGDDAITKVPVSRWESDNGWGGFLEQVDQFEPQFFSISPREAINIDPQQRLLLEVSWEALENAGLAAEQLAGSRSGVFIGISSGDYAKLRGNLTNTEAYYGTGNAFSIAANRLSYFLDWHGPSWAVDTACSSSLVAVHQACQSLLQKDCNLALAGGVNLILSPQLSLTFSEAQMLAEDGRCKTFDAAADGYVRSEGCGVVVLKRLDDALANGDNIQAVIRGSAVNQDGLTNGLTAPNGKSQQEVIRLALAKAGVKPNEISYVETHGTGTSLGDPMEVNSLKAVLTEGRELNQPCWIGSVKTNIGHTEAAAGIAGLIKLVLSLEQGEIPPHLHLKQLNPYIELEQTLIKIPTQLQQWSSGEEPRRAGVSAFGFGGTNAHVILEEAPSSVNSYQLPVTNDKKLERSLHVLTLSAKTEKALKELVSSYQNHLETHSELALGDICFTANTGRSHFNHRLAIITSNKPELAAKLAKISVRKEATDVFSGKLPSNSSLPKIAFLFTGQGSQYINMGIQLYETQTVFRQALDQCEQILTSYLDKSLLDVIYPENTQELNSSLIDQTAYTQPALFAIEYALAKLWQSWGIKPDVVMGHSVGEYVAATVAGVFSLEDGLKLIAHRGRLMQQLPSGGEMIAVMASEEQVNQLIAPYTEKVVIAALNGPVSVVISGAAEAVGTVRDSLEAEGIKTKQLQVSHAFHSPLMEPMLAEFETITNQITYHQPRVPLISNVTGTRADESITTARYWVNHVRQPVKFVQSMDTLHQEGYEVFVEIGPQPILLGMGRRCLPKGVGVWLPSLRDGQEDWKQMLQSLGELYVRGVKVDWSGFDKGCFRSKCVLPTYPFQRERYWLEGAKPESSKQNNFPNKTFHPLLGQQLRSPGIKEIFFESQFSLNSLPFLKHHLVYGIVVVPGANHVSMVLSAAAKVFGAGVKVIQDLLIHEAFVLGEDDVRSVQLILKPKEPDNFAFQIFSVEEGAEEQQTAWKLHATGKVHRDNTNAAVSGEQLSLTAVQARCQEELSAQAYYQQIRELGLDLGISFQGISQLWRCNGEALAQIKLPDVLMVESDAYEIHPAFLDACFQLVGVCIPNEGVDSTNKDIYVPVHVGEVKFYARPGYTVWCHSCCEIEEKLNKETFVGNLRLFDENGKIVAEVFGLAIKRAPRKALLYATRKHLNDWLYEVEWQAQNRLHPEIVGLPSDYIPDSLEIINHLKVQLPLLSNQHGLEVYQELLPKLNDLSIYYILRALQKLNRELHRHQRLSVTSLVEELNIVPQHHRLVGRMLEMLQEDGLLTKVDGVWEVCQIPDISNLQQEWTEAAQEYPSCQAELSLLERCGTSLADVLRGKVDTLQLLFPEGSVNQVENLYQESPGAQVINTLVQEVIAVVLASLPAGRKIRILEIGAGTGGTTSYVLPKLPAEQTEYVFTDVSYLFTSKAEHKFRDYPFVQYQLLDIEQDPQAQGFAAHQFDVILAANVLHATADLRQTLKNVQQLLAPEGLLVLLEAIGRQRTLDLTFGLTEGWWRFADRDLRPSYPLLSPSNWLNVLQELGFTQTVALPETEDTQGQLSQQAVILARNPAIDKEIEPHAVVSPAKQGYWLIFADRGGLAQQLGEQLQLQNEKYIFVYPGTAYESLEEGIFTIDPAQPEQFQKLCQRTLGADDFWCCGVIHLWSLESPLAKDLTDLSLKSSKILSCGSVLYLVQAMLAVGGSKLPRLWLVTQDAQTVQSSPRATMGVAQASLWGLGRVLAKEHPELWGGLIDLDAQADLQNMASLLLEEILNPDPEDHLAFREGQRYVARLVRQREPALLAEPLCLQSDATYLVTGGLGGLGLKVAQWMVELGAQHLVLVGRSGASVTTNEALTALQQAGVQVVVEQADVSQEEQVLRVLTNISQSLPPLRGIIHGAGVLNDGVLLQQDWERFTSVLAPKVDGAWNLHKHTLNLSLDFFVLFSSVAALFGPPAQANHAAANAFLDALAHYRLAAGLPGLSINWGIWDEVGAAAKRKAGERMAIQGIGTIKPQQGLQVLEQLFQHPSAQVGVMPINWRQWRQSQSKVVNSPLLAQLIQEEAEFQLQDEQQGKVSLTKGAFLAAEPQERRQLLESYLHQQVAKILRMPVSELDVQQPLTNLGLDSLMAIEFKNQVENNLEVLIPVTKLLEGPSIAQLAEELFQQVTTKNISSTVVDVAEKTGDVNQIDANNWIINDQLNTDARLRLFCFHYLGGGASAFRKWSDRFPPEIQVCPIQLPGRENRINEQPFERIESLVEMLAQVLYPYMDRPFAFYGHSMGALISFELARQLRRQHGLIPVHLFAAAYYAPHAISPFQKISDIKESELISSLPRLLDAPESLLKKTEFIEALLPTVKADLQIVGKHVYSDEEPLDCPISAFGGLKDKEVSYDDLSAWSEHTQSKFNLQMFPGKHLFLLRDREIVTQSIIQELMPKRH